MLEKTEKSLCCNIRTLDNDNFRNCVKTYHQVNYITNKFLFPHKKIVILADGISLRRNHEQFKR